MAIRLTPPVTKEYPLIKSDEKYGNIESPTLITVRQATQGDYDAREALFSKTERVFANNGEVRISSELSSSDLARFEVYLTLAACNIETDGGKPLFEFENGRIKDRRAFEKAWALLDPTIAQEIHDCVLDLNMMWAFPTIQGTRESES